MHGNLFQRCSRWQPAVERSGRALGAVRLPALGRHARWLALPEEARPFVEAKAREEDRVVIRLSPEWSVYTPPVHLHAGDDGSKMQHGLAERMAWR